MTHPSLRFNRSYGGSCLEAMFEVVMHIMKKGVIDFTKK